MLGSRGPVEIVCFRHEWGDCSYHELNSFALPFSSTINSFLLRQKNTADLTLQVERNTISLNSCLFHLDKHLLVNTYVKHSGGWDEESGHKGKESTSCILHICTKHRNISNPVFSHIRFSQINIKLNFARIHSIWCWTKPNPRREKVYFSKSLASYNILIMWCIQLVQ